MIDSGSEDEGLGNPEEYVLAMHDFFPQPPNATCLTFHAGQVIHVLNRDASGWWDGEVDGRRGWFPSNYVTSEVGLLTEEELPGGKVCPLLLVRVWLSLPFPLTATPHCLGAIHETSFEHTSAGSSCALP